jgi:hypothetical protein
MKVKMMSWPEECARARAHLLRKSRIASKNHAANQYEAAIWILIWRWDHGGRHQFRSAVRPECIAPESNPAPGAKYHTHIQYPRSGVWNNERGGNKEKRVSGRLVLITCKTHQRAFFAPAGILIAAHYQIAEDARACTSFSLSLCEWPIMRRRRRLLWSTMLIRT